MGEGLFQPMHLLVLILVAMILFAPKKIGELGKGLGEGITGFRKALRGDDAKPAQTEAAKPAAEETKKA